MNRHNIVSTAPGFLALGILIGGCGLALLLFQQPNTPEFTLSLCSAGMGLALTLGAAILIRRGARNQSHS
ncbi:MAG: hypothetical protein DIU68_012140 [Chloroflexota bacterium]|nr:MAG: hypothetical protein DIU68_05015 [Chloroflexota bacterium]